MTKPYSPWGAGLLVTGLLLFMMPGVQAAPQFMPPNGLPLDTPLGPDRNADGSAAMSFRTMGRDIAKNTTDLTNLRETAVTKEALTSALAPYLTSTSADARYASPSSVTAALKVETDRATSAEQIQARDLANLRDVAVTEEVLTASLAPYLTGTSADARYATPASVTAAVRGETDRATSAEQTKLDKADAAATYLPLGGGDTTGPVNGLSVYRNLFGSSASGASVTLTSDNTGVLTGANCFVVPTGGVTRMDVTVVGISSNGTDAVLQTFSGLAARNSGSAATLARAGNDTTYPAFGSSQAWSVVLGVDAPTRCVSLTGKGAGTGSWKWRAAIRYETLAP